MDYIQTLNLSTMDKNACSSLIDQKSLISLFPNNENSINIYTVSLLSYFKEIEYNIFQNFYFVENYPFEKFFEKNTTNQLFDKRPQSQTRHSKPTSL